MVTGPPGSGKTTLARPLAAELGWPLLAKDTVKEALGDVLADVAGPRLSAAAFEVLFALAAEVHGPLLLEGNFRPEARPALAALGPAVEVRCRCDVELAVQRYNDRSDRHAVHGYVPAVTAELLRTMGGEPLDLGGPVIDVDTTGQVDVVDLARRITSLVGAS